MIDWPLHFFLGPIWPQTVASVQLASFVSNHYQLSPDVRSNHQLRHTSACDFSKHQLRQSACDFSHFDHVPDRIEVYHGEHAASNCGPIAGPRQCQRPFPNGISLVSAAAAANSACSSSNCKYGYCTLLTQWPHSSTAGGSAC